MRKIVIVGGGVAAGSCLEALVHDFEQGNLLPCSITLISATGTLKKVINYSLKGRNLESFDILEVDLNDSSKLVIPKEFEYKFILGQVKHVLAIDKTIVIACDNKNNHHVQYDTLCVCTGATPKDLNFDGCDNDILKERLITIRDTDSVIDLKNKLCSARRVAIIGNGGISLELAYKITDCEKVWIVRDEHIGKPFLDSQASKLLIESQSTSIEQPIVSGIPNCSEIVRGVSKVYGPALGPHWQEHQNLRGTQCSDRSLEVIYQRSVERIYPNQQCEWPMSLTLSDGEIVECDYVINAIGVSPNPLLILGDAFELDEHNGIVIDEQMRTSINDVYAAGDVVSCKKWATNCFWFQMRLWTQARQMGYYCGRCIASHLVASDPMIYFNFDCFAHVTRFFGKKIVLLGHYNLQGEQKNSDNVELLVKFRENLDYVKLVIKDNRIIGAILVGETNLEETIENLICDQLNIETVKDNLLDEIVDIEDYFD